MSARPTVPPPEAGPAELLAALARHARDEAVRTAAARAADRLRELRGPESTAEELVRLLAERLGGGATSLFCSVGGVTCRGDARGVSPVAGEGDDGLVRYVLETRACVCRRAVPGPAGAAEPGPEGTVTRWMPLPAGAGIAGVLRFDDLDAAGGDPFDEVEPLLSFAGKALAIESSASDGEPREGAALLRRAAALDRARDELERRLEERGAALRATLETTSSAVFSLDRQHRYLAFNRVHADAMRTLYGAGIETGRSILDFMTVAEDRETATRNLERALAGELHVESAPSGARPAETRYYDIAHHPLRGRDGSVIGTAILAADVTGRRLAEVNRASHLRFLESLDQVNRAMQGTSDLEQMLSDVLDVVVAVFGCDRAWLVYPCDPASATYRVPMERTRPEYPGALVHGLEMPVDEETARLLQALEASAGPVTFGPGLQQPLPRALGERFHVRSQIAVAVRPRVSAPYAFGLHQCSSPRSWTDEEAMLLQEIGRRLGDALTSLQAFRDLEVSEGRYRTLLQQIQAAVVVHGADGLVLASNRKAQELLGLPEERILGKATTDPAWSFFRPDGSVVRPEEYPARLVCSTRQPLRNVVARIHRPAERQAGDVWVLVNADPVVGRDGEVSQVIVTFSDVTSQKRAEERLQKEAERGSRLLDLFLRSPRLSERQVHEGVVELAARLTGSTIGFLQRVSEDQRPVRLAAWSEPALAGSSVAWGEHDPAERTGAWAECVRLGRPVITDGLASPPDRAPLRRCLSVPVVEEGLVRIVLAVGNKDAPYDESDVFQVQQVANELQKLVRQRHAVERVEHLGRLYRTVSEMNQVIVREKSRDRLFSEVCRIGVEHGGFAMAWAGLVDRQGGTESPGGTVRPAGAAGLEAGYADELEIRLDAPPAGLRPAARAVVEDRTVLVEDTETDPGFAPWRHEARERGFRSCAAFPVRADGRVLGVLAVYAGEAGVFQGGASALLGGLAADLGFTLRALETEEQRARTERALRESEERYRLIAENTADTISVLDLDLRFTYVSPSVLKLRGYTAEECLEQSLEQVVTPGSLEAIRKRLAEELALEAGGGADPSRSASIELEEYRRDGSTIWVEVTFSFLRDDALRPTAVLAVTRDVSRRKQADLRLAESEQKFRSLAESSPENIIRYDADGRMVYVNANLERTVRFDFGTRLGTVPDEHEPAFPDQATYVAKLRRVIRSGEPDEMEMDVPGPAGGRRTHSILFVAERDGDGRVIGALAFGRDITDRKEADRERQRYLVQLRQNLEDAVAAIAATIEARDPYTAGHQKRVAALSAEVARELGLDAETVQGIHLAGTIHDLGKIKIPAEILARPGGLSALETRLVQLHPEAGWEILKGVEFPWPIAEMVLQHHERMDGSGYPRGLRGEQISLGARILAVADVVEAVASHRPYRPARDLELVLSDLERDPEGCFDPVVAKACLTLFREKGFRFRD